MSIKKSIFKIFNGTSWDEYYHKTSADQVVYTKPDGTASNVQAELAEQNSAFRVVQFQTGQYTDTEYEIPFPDGWEFWNTMLLNFSIDLEGSLRDAIHIGAVDVWSSRGYTIKNAKGTSRNAWALIYKFR